MTNIQPPIMLPETAFLISIADEFAAASGLTHSVVSFRCFNDVTKLNSMRNGTGITVKRYNNAIRWFKDNWPPDQDVPERVARLVLPGCGDPLPEGSVAEAAE